MSLTHAAAQLLVFLGLAVAVWVGPRFRGWQVTAVLAVGLSIAVVAGWRVAHMREQRLEFDPSVLPYTCRGVAPAMCGPQDAAKAYPLIAAALGEVAKPLRRAGVTNVPAQFSLDYPGSPQPPRGTGVIALSSEQFRDAPARRVAAVVGMTTPSTCDDLSPFAPPPPEKVMLVRAMVTGWLAQRTGVRMDGHYPSDLVAALERLPVDAQHRWIRQTFRSMWACDNKALAMPPGIPLPDYMTQQ